MAQRSGKMCRCANMQMCELGKKRIFYNVQMCKCEDVQIK